MNQSAMVSAVKSNSDEPADEAKAVLLSEIKSLVEQTKRLSES